MISVQNAVNQNLNSELISHALQILIEKFCHIVFDIKLKFASSRPMVILGYLKKWPFSLPLSRVLFPFPFPFGHTSAPIPMGFPRESHKKGKFHSHTHI